MFQFIWRLFHQKYSVFELTRKWCEENEFSYFADSQGSSTNDLAKEEAFSISTPLRIYLLDQQTKGRGRGSNQWLNPIPGNSLMVSFSFEMERPPQPIATPLVGLAIAKALKKSFSLPTLSIKAPNDIYIGSKKVAGLLIEAAQMGEQCRFIVGFGLNVFSAPEGVSEAGYLAEEFSPSKRAWLKFLDRLQIELRLASQEAMGSHLSESQREELLVLLNKKYDSISPFGDLSSNNQVISWRDL